MKRKVLLLANTDWYLYNFRLSLAQKLRGEGFEVVLVSPKGRYSGRLEALGFRWIQLDLDSSGINPIRELRAIFGLVKLFRQERPDLVHSFTIKCNLYGGLAAKLVNRIPVINALTGLGHVYTSKGWKARLARPFAKMLQKYVLAGEKTHVIFQNDDDRQKFVSLNIVEDSKTSVIRGSGVNCSTFSAKAKVSKTNGDPVKVLFASRMIKEKGICELLDAIRMLKSKGIEFETWFAGEIYPGNPSSLTEKQLIQIVDDGLVKHFGHIDDIKYLLERSDIVVLPSYREGTPRILIEAAAMGRAIVSTDIPGCRGLVRHGINGLLVKPKRVEELAQALEELITSPQKRIDFGRAGREIVLNEFDEEIVIAKTIDVYSRLLCPPRHFSRPVAVRTDELNPVLN